VPSWDSGSFSFGGRASSDGVSGCQKEGKRIITRRGGGGAHGEREM